MVDNINNILKIIKKNKKKIDISKINEKDNLIEQFNINSLEFISIMTEIEKYFKIEIESEDLIISNFDTIEKINNYILKKNSN